MARQHRDEIAACESKPHNLPLVTARHKKEKEELEGRLKEELQVADEKIIQELDQIVTEQQSTLHEAAVPFFSVTSDPSTVKLQMYVLEFLQRLAPSNQWMLMNLRSTGTEGIITITHNLHIHNFALP